jgi:hypothetical protein
MVAPALLGFEGRLESVAVELRPFSELRSLMVDTSPEDATVEIEAEEAILSARFDGELFSRTL